MTEIKKEGGKASLSEKLVSDYRRLQLGIKELPQIGTSAEILVPLLQELLRQAEATAKLEAELRGEKE